MRGIVRALLLAALLLAAAVVGTLWLSGRGEKFTLGKRNYGKERLIEYNRHVKYDRFDRLYEYRYGISVRCDYGDDGRPAHRPYLSEKYFFKKS